MAVDRILVVRLGAMGDIIHALPAVAGLRRANPKAEITWLVEPRWRPLLEGNPNINHIAEFQRASWKGMAESVLALRGKFDISYDMQGLLKSAIPAWVAAKTVVGYGNPRESTAKNFYSLTVNPTAVHIVDQHMELVAAAASPRDFAMPAGQPEGSLPSGGFVLASPAAGWPGKEWPRDRYEQLRGMLRAKGIALVLNGPPGCGLDHESSIAGLIDATRRATAVFGVDSGPLHIAAALGKPGVAIFGPTEPARNGPYGGTIKVLRSATAVTTYRRSDKTDESMLAITPAQVMDALGL